MVEVVEGRRIGGENSKFFVGRGKLVMSSRYSPGVIR